MKRSRISLAFFFIKKFNTNMRKIIFTMTQVFTLTHANNWSDASRAVNLGLARCAGPT